MAITTLLCIESGVRFSPFQEMGILGNATQAQAKRLIAMPSNRSRSRLGGAFLYSVNPFY